jgi:hypothetical protein
MVMAASTQLSKDVHRTSVIGRETNKRRHRQNKAHTEAMHN